MQDINYYYTRFGVNEEFLLLLFFGDLCCVQFLEDGCWYRGLVLGIQLKGVIVQYVDYGNFEILLIIKIKKFIFKFFDLL